MMPGGVAVERVNAPCLSKADRAPGNLLLPRIRRACLHGFAAGRRTPTWTPRPGPPDRAVAAGVQHSRPHVGPASNQPRLLATGQRPGPPGMLRPWRLSRRTEPGPGCSPRSRALRRPLGQAGYLPARQQVHQPTGAAIDHRRAVDAALARRVVIDVDQSQGRRLRLRQGRGQQSQHVLRPADTPKTRAIRAPVRPAQARPAGPASNAGSRRYSWVQRMSLGRLRKQEPARAPPYCPRPSRTRPPVLLVRPDRAVLQGAGGPPPGVCARGPRPGSSMDARPARNRGCLTGIRSARWMRPPPGGRRLQPPVNPRAACCAASRTGAFGAP